MTGKEFAILAWEFVSVVGMARVLADVFGFVGSALKERRKRRAEEALRAMCTHCHGTGKEPRPLIPYEGQT